MYGSWTEYAVLWTNSLGFIWDIWYETVTRSINPEFERKVDVQT